MYTMVLYIVYSIIISKFVRQKLMYDFHNDFQCFLLIIFASNVQIVPKNFEAGGESAPEFGNCHLAYIHLKYKKC